MLEPTDALVIEPEANDSVTAPLGLDSFLTWKLEVNDDFTVVGCNVVAPQRC